MAAEFSALALCTQAQWQKSWINPRKLQRKCSTWKDNDTCAVIPRKDSCLVKSVAIRLLGGFNNRRKKSPCCMGSLLIAQDISPVSWVSTVDQLLLIITIAFAYMAGAVPQSATYKTEQSGTSKDAVAAPNINVSGRCSTPENTTKSRDSWVQVDKKLSDALEIVNSDSDIKWDKNTKCPVSLLAIKGGSRLRLLHETLHRIHKEVAKISQVHEGADRETREVIFSRVIQDSVQPILLSWLEEELSMLKQGRDKELIYGVVGKLKADESVLQKIKLMEKTYLYVDLLFFLRFPSYSAHYYDDCILMQYEREILEDLVITLADGICNIYLELISLDSDLSPEINYLGSSLCSLSTRALQRLRNQVALDQWLTQNFESVISMYEDRFDLSVLARKTVEESDMDVSGTSNFWRNYLFRKQSPAVSSYYLIITGFPILVKRTKEFKALVGWRYYYSLFLELSDIAMPLIKAAFVKARSAVSFFLTCLIGRSLGLIYSGIRQSLNWR